MLKGFLLIKYFPIIENPNAAQILKDYFLKKGLDQEIRLSLQEEMDQIPHLGEGDEAVRILISHTIIGVWQRNSANKLRLRLKQAMRRRLEFSSYYKNYS